MKKTLRIVRQVLVAAIAIFAVLVMVFTLISVTSFNNQRGLLGYQFFVVLSDSMKGTFETGDVVVSRTTDPETLEVGDIITFRSSDPNYFGLVVTHKIRGVTAEDGERAFVTYGAATDEDDTALATASNVLGKYLFRVPKAGYVFDYLRSPVGYGLMVLVPFVLLVALLGVRFGRLMRVYRGERQEEVVSRDRLLEAGREKEAQLEAELAEMRARLSAVSGSPPKEPPEKHVDEFEKLIDDFEDAINYSEKRVDDSEEPIEAAAAAPDVSGDAVEPSER